MLVQSAKLPSYSFRTQENGKEGEAVELSNCTPMRKKKLSGGRLAKEEEYGLPAQVVFFEA